MKAIILLQTNLLVAFLTLALCSVACGDERSPVNENHRNKKSKELDIDHQLIAELTEKIKKSAKSDYCFKTSTSPENECDMRTVYFDSGSFQMPKSTNESILIIEQSIDVFLATTRYRNRYKNFYTVEDGRIIPANPKVEIPSSIFEIMESLANADFIPAHALEEISKIIGNNYPNLASKYSNHNSTIQEILMEYNPHSPVVGINDFADLEKTFDKNIICGFKSLKRKKQHILERTDHLSNDLERIIKRDQISFANMSFGLSAKSIFADFEALCDKTANSKLVNIILQSFEASFNTLGNNRQIITVQSSPYQTWDDGPYDCNANYQMRFMAGAYNEAPTQSWHARSKSKIEKVGICADAYLNFNTDFSSKVDDPSTLMASLGMGFGMGRMGRRTSVSTSHAAPLLLSHLIFLRNTDQYRLKNIDLELVDNLRHDLTDCAVKQTRNCKLINPLANKQLRVHSLKYW